MRLFVNLVHVDVYLCMNKEIKGFDGYHVSINGEVRRHGKLVKTFLSNNHGRHYETVSLVYKSANHSLRKCIPIHRLVAEYWLNKPDDPAKTIVKHKDGNLLNNKAFNLMWASKSEIMKGIERKSGQKHTAATKARLSERMKGKAHPRYKGQYICGYKAFDSATQAGKALGFSTNTVISRCSNKKWREKGWYFVPK